MGTKGEEERGRRRMRMRRILEGGYEEGLLRLAFYFAGVTWSVLSGVVSFGEWYEN